MPVTRIVQDVMKLRKHNSTIYEIADPNDSGRIVYEPDRLRKLLSEK